MKFWGLHWIDISIVLAYLAGVLAIGQYLSKRVKGQSDFYLAGRSLGKAFQFFLNFGQMTDSSGAPSTASVVYTQGVGGVWISFQTLLMTPYYWFMNVWFRRVRLMTVADLFEDRFGGRFLSGLYALFTIWWSIMMIAWGNLVAYKTLAPMMVKPASQYTAVEAQMVQNFKKFTTLRHQSQSGELPKEKMQRYETLKSLYEKNQLNSYVSYLSPIVFYVGSGLIVALYIIMGGFTAAAMINALQAVLIVAFSVMLIPFGLSKVGGFSGLHAAVPDYMFSLFGSEATSEYTWYSIMAILFVSMVQIHAVNGNMANSGSAKNELAARFGAVSGGFGKRFIIVAWTLCALIAIGIYGSSLSDPDNAWGVLSTDLLPVGAIGMMLAGILAGKMASLGSNSITLSALFVRNLYLPLVPDKSEKHYVLIGRVAIAALLALGVAIALMMTGVISLIKSIIAMNVVFGAPILMIFFWRRLTKAAVVIQVFVCILFIIIIPWLVVAIPCLRQNPVLVQQSVAHTSDVRVHATDEDVRNKLATEKGQLITKQHRLEPQSLFFEGLAHTNPQDTSSLLEGLGRFHSEVYLAYLLGINVKNMTPAGLMTTRFTVDGALPFALLWVLSLVTKPADKARCDRFYVRMKTPVAATLEEDAMEIEKSYANLTRFDHLKLFKKSSWEMCKWDLQDGVGFILCWVMVGFILVFFMFLLKLGS